MLLNSAIVPALCFHLRNNIVVYALLCFPDVTEHFGQKTVYVYCLLQSVRMFFHGCVTLVFRHSV